MPDYPDSGQLDERAMLLDFLRFQRETMLWKAEGLTREQCSQTTAASTLTLGGLLKHASLVESWWIEQVLAGLPAQEPWASADFDGDPDWEFTSSRDDEPDDLRQLYLDTIARTDAIIARTELDDHAAGRSGFAGQPTLRWILLHLIGEMARHAGHADLLREAVDGATGWRGED